MSSPSSSPPPVTPQRIEYGKEAARWNQTAAPAEVGVSGSAAAIADAAQSLVGQGVTSVVIQPTGDEPDLESFIHFLGAEVKPLLAGMAERRAVHS